MKIGILLTTLTGLFIVGCTKENTLISSYKAAKEAQVSHIHGIGYVGNESELYIATHEGLVKYVDDKWFEDRNNKHDYIAFEPLNNGFYTSGYQYSNSNVKTPLGIIRSVDEGKSIEFWQFYGETDFSHLTAGYNQQSLYVINEIPNQKLNKGLYYSLDKGVTWTQSLLYGLTTSAVSRIAAHPSEPNILAVSTKVGLFYSSDFGDNFKLVSEPNMITTVYVEENSLLYSSIEGEDVFLNEMSMDSSQVSRISLPKLLKENPITNISSNPKNREEVTITTLRDDIFLSLNRGKEWTKISSYGKLD